MELFFEISRDLFLPTFIPESKPHVKYRQQMHDEAPLLSTKCGLCAQMKTQKNEGLVPFNERGLNVAPEDPEYFVVVRSALASTVRTFWAGTRRVQHAMREDKSGTTSIRAVSGLGLSQSSRMKTSHLFSLYFEHTWTFELALNGWWIALCMTGAWRGLIFCTRFEPKG